MDPEKRAKRQSFRIIVSEMFMVLAVVVTVAVLAFVVSGYWVNGDFKVERQGMLQISSLPTGADVYVDGESAWNQRTNTSKVLSTGEHTIELKKEGYDSWHRTINIVEGLLYRVHYPRLFLLEREKTTAYDIGATTYSTISPNRENALLANETTTWHLLNLNSDEIVDTPVDVSTVFSAVSLAPGADKGLFNAKILDADWSTDNNHVLFRVLSDSNVEWVVLDVKNPKTSTNISKEFNIDFQTVKIYDNSASNLLAISDGNLHKIDVSSKQLSAVLARDVKNFDFFGSEIIISAKEESDQTYYVGEIASNGEIKSYHTGFVNAPHIGISKFYDEKYITVLDGNKLAVYDKADDSVFIETTLTISPETLTTGHDGEFVTMTVGPSIVTVDMEAKEVHEWSPNTHHYGWLDSDMLYSINDGELLVYDFDGLNCRKLAKNVSSHFPVTITNDKWLYYVSDDSLIREKITN